MMLFKRCPRCRGDLYVNSDGFGKYVSCLQCGYLKDIPADTTQSTEVPVTVGPGGSAQREGNPRRVTPPRRRVRIGHQQSSLGLPAVVGERRICPH